MKATLESAEAAHNHSTYAVSIAGAGPVGLLACELALAKCSVLVLERAAHPHSPLKQLPFGLRGLNAPSVEALHRRGLLPELAAPSRLQQFHFSAPADGVAVQAGNYSWHGGWLVGCDGGRSMVRCARRAALTLPVRSRNLPATRPRLTWPTPSSCGPAAT